MTTVVILDRIEPDHTPPYCTHGRTTCVGGCGEWLWLGDQTHAVVAAGRAVPICLPCATKLVPAGARAHRHVEDHQREATQ